MEINSNNLINTDILQTKKLDNVKPEDIKDAEELRKVSNDFESVFFKSNNGYFIAFNKYSRRRCRF